MLNVNAASGFGSGGGGGGRADMGDLLQDDLAWHFRADQGITVDGSDDVTAWLDWKGGSAGSISLTGTSTTYPAYTSDGTVGTLAEAGYMTFDGVNDILKSTSVTVASQPIHVFFVFKPLSWTVNDSFFSGKGGGTTSVHFNQGPTTPKARFASGTTGDGEQDFTLDEWSLMIGLANSTSSSCARNDGAALSDGNNQTLAMETGFFLGAQAAIVQWAHVVVSELAIYDAAMTGSDLTDIKDYFNNQYGLW